MSVGHQEKKSSTDWSNALMTTKSPFMVRLKHTMFRYFVTHLKQNYDISYASRTIKLIGEPLV